MTRITIAPNASGTGVMTLAAPNTNTDRTITLPDATGTMNISGLANEVPAGSAGSPSIYSTGDSNTGVFFPAADTVAVATAGVERLRVDSSGNLQFSGTGQRILGDFSNATDTSKLLFQTTTANSSTIVGVIPSGTGTIAALNLMNNSDPKTS